MLHAETGGGPAGHAQDAATTAGGAQLLSAAAIMGGGRGAGLTALGLAKSGLVVTGAADGVLQARRGAGLRRLRVPRAPWRF
jgi:hypothetical protein